MVATFLWVSTSFVLISAFWPSLQLSAGGIRVVNVRGQFVPWEEVTRVRVGPQLHHLPWLLVATQIWRLAPGPGIGGDAMDGLLIDRSDGTTIAVFSVQCPEFFAPRYVRQIQLEILKYRGAVSSPGTLS